MLYLTVVSLIWAFSFGLIKETLTGIDPTLVATIRIALSLLVFLPFLRVHSCKGRIRLQLIGIGACQYGVMYICYISSYQWLAAHEVALFTIFTPLFVTAIHDILTRRFHRLFLLTALLAIAGTAIIQYDEIRRAGFWTGFFLMQISNICFAFGQIAYKKLKIKIPDVADHSIFALLYAGALSVCLLAAGFTVEWHSVGFSAYQIAALLYLGIVASGICFFLWNKGATRTNAGALAIFNNLKIPLAITVSLLFFGESTDLLRLCIGGSIVVGALGINERFLRRRV
jgi:drug/metabolite transporter (DMT)-like permease